MSELNIILFLLLASYATSVTVSESPVELTKIHHRGKVFCATLQTLAVISDSEQFKREASNFLSVWSDAACLSVLESNDTLDNSSIIISFTAGDIDKIDIEPYSYCHITAKPTTKIHVGRTLALLLGTRFDNSLEIQRELLQQAAFKHSSLPVSVWIPPDTPSKFQLIKGNVALTFDKTNCTNARLNFIKVPINTTEVWGTISIAQNVNYYAILRQNTPLIYIATNKSSPQLFTLPFAALAVGFWQNDTLLILDTNNRIYSGVFVRNQFRISTTHIHTVNSTAKALFTTYNNTKAFVITDSGIQQIIFRPSPLLNSFIYKQRHSYQTAITTTRVGSALEQHVCVLDYFLPKKYDTRTPNALQPLYPYPQEKRTKDAVLNFIERVHPELLLVCLVVLLPLVLIALPIVAFTGEITTRLYKRFLQSRRRT